MQQCIDQLFDHRLFGVFINPLGFNRYRLLFLLRKLFLHGGQGLLLDIFRTLAFTIPM